MNEKHHKLSDTHYMAFPFRVEKNGPRTEKRAEHIRSQIEQVLFTSPNERVFRPEFGAGVKSLVFEPNHSPVWELAKRRLLASLQEALLGEVDPNSIQADVSGEDVTLRITITYRLATIGIEQSHQFAIGAVR